MSKHVRMLICAYTGAEFPYSGRGRPPIYSPEGRAKRARDVRAAKAAALKAAKAA